MKTKMTGKKLFALLITIVMTLSILPGVAMADAEPISSVTLDGSGMLPVAGEAPGKLTVPEGAPYEIVMVTDPFGSDDVVEAQFWVEDAHPPILPESFEAGQSYVYELGLKPKDGESFAPDATLDVTGIPWDKNENGALLTKSYVETDEDSETYGCLIFAGGYTVPYTLEIPIEKHVVGEGAPETTFWFDTWGLNISDSKTTVTGKTITTNGASTSPYTGAYTFTTSDEAQLAILKHENGFYLKEDSFLPWGWSCSGEVYHIVYDEEAKDFKIWATEEDPDSQMVYPYIDTEPVEKATFTNTYSAADIVTEKLVIPFKKVVEGAGAAAADFEFELRHPEGGLLGSSRTNTPVITGTTVETTGGARTYTGTIVIEDTPKQIESMQSIGFCMVEKIPEDTGDWTYSEEKYYFMTNEETGELNISDKGYYDDPVEEIVFTNVYNGAPQFFDVTFAVENGTWADGKTDDIKIAVHIGQPLSATDIPTGMLPNENYTDGAWAPELDTTNEVTDDVTYTYTFVEQEGDAETRFVTFKVVNGTWADGKTDAIEYAIPVGELLDSSLIPTGMLPNAEYADGSWDNEPDTETPVTDDVTYTYTFKADVDDNPGGNDTPGVEREDDPINHATEDTPIIEKPTTAMPQTGGNESATIALAIMLVAAGLSGAAIITQRKKVR